VRRLLRLGVLISALVMLALVGGCGDGEGEDSSKSSTENGGSSHDISEQVDVIADLEDGYGFRRVYAVAPDLADDEAVVDLMTRLHEEEPDAWWWLYDSDEQAEVLAETLPRTAEGDTDGYPADWVEEHTVAHLVLETDGSNRQWVIYDGWETVDQLGTLPYDGEYD